MSFLIPIRKLRRIFLITVSFSLIFIVIQLFFSNNGEILQLISSSSFSSRFSISTTTATTTTTATSSTIDFHLSVSGIDSNYNVHVFYYCWYGNIDTDGRWIHWNHQRLPHWSKLLAKDYSTAPHEPPDDIGADFYPAIGLYSSRDRATIRKHLAMIKWTGVGVVVLSWPGPGRADPNGVPVDDLMPVLLHEADKLALKVALHLEPYSDRTTESVKNDLVYIEKNYSNHSAYFKKPRFKHNKPLPVVFIYDSYLIKPPEWVRIFGERRNMTIRNTQTDFFVVGLLLDRDSCSDLSDAGFDAGYTYFAGDQVSYSSHSDHWIEIQRKCYLKNIQFFPSFGPGYKDESVRPWNSLVTRDRRNGKYFLERFKKVQESGARSFGITSFNEWHEGTQIEPAVPHSNSNSRLIYEDYSPNSPLFYLNLTKIIVNSFTKNTNIHL